MNEQGKQALVKVAEWLEAGAPHVVVKDGVEVARFDMEYAAYPVGSGCGTACCIAGTVCQFEGLLELDSDGGLDFYSGEGDDPYTDDESTGAGPAAREFLGITEDQARDLFTPWAKFEFDFCSDFSEPKKAAAVVRHFLETDEVDWDLFDNDGNKV